jgi:phosphoribosyl-ATP pyrophosphohydrolase
VPALWRTISERKAERPDGSYVVSLLDAGVARCAQKVGEEGVEVGLAAVAGDRDALVAEAADLVFHLYVLLAAGGVDLSEVEDELARRAH